jgi:hypothetical protein
MNKLFPALIACVALAPAAVQAAGFEGHVAFKISSSRGQPQEMSYDIKGDKFRVEMPGQKGMGGMIMDLTKRETTMIMDQQKMYMTMAMPEAGAAGPAGKKGEDVTLEKTGEKETTLGHPAEKYVASSSEGKTDLWLAEGLGTFMMARGGGPMGGGKRGGNGPAAQAWEKALAGKELFPLRVVGHDIDGKESFRMEVTALEKKSIPDTLFAPPAGYQKFDMGGMMKGMMPGRPGR